MFFNIRICAHRKRRTECRDCGGSSYISYLSYPSRLCGICKHGRLKTACNDCGSCYCVHNEILYCIECGGNALSVHGRQQKIRCKECVGSSVCEHANLKHLCKECGGNAYASI
jgi:hypothetical protein